MFGRRLAILTAQLAAQPKPLSFVEFERGDFPLPDFQPTAPHYHPLEGVAESWRTAEKMWHKGPPPHDGLWGTRIYDCYYGHWRFYIGGEWKISFEWMNEKVGTIKPHYKQRTAHAQQNNIEWFGYAPDAEGWIRWDATADSTPPVDPDAQVDYILASGWSCGSNRAEYLAWQTHDVKDDIVAYRPRK